MASEKAADGLAYGNAGVFSTTRWTLILSARSHHSEESSKALTTLCETYWRPLYAYALRRGYSVEDAKDLIQEFFARFLEKDYLKDVHRERGKFRSFLLACLNHFLANEWDKARAQKRGGGIAPISFDFATAEGDRELELSHALTPEVIYEREWALALLNKVLLRLKDDYTNSNKGVLFEQLKPVLIGGEGRLPYKELSVKLGLSEGAVKVAAHRLKVKYRETLREEIAQTVENIEDIEDEMRYLQTALGT